MTSRLRFVDLFAGLGGFHRALADLGHECVFASEINEELRRLYPKRFPEYAGDVHGDIRERAVKRAIPEHDVLCAGFPCQPFSKSGSQMGFGDPTRGTLFHEIVTILRWRRPEYIILENVGNFERHDHGNTWKVVQQKLDELGYEVRGTTHKRSRGPGLISPHHLGYPHTRERFFMVGRLRFRGGLPPEPFPDTGNPPPTTLDDVVQSPDDLTERDRRETRLTRRQLRYIAHWSRFLRYTASVELPSFPIWGDELLVDYPIDGRAPDELSEKELRDYLGLTSEEPFSKEAWLATLPAYARRYGPDGQYPEWKRDFIRRNRVWLSEIRPQLPERWISRLRELPPSHRKLEWNCKGAERNLRAHVIQFRPSGLRVKRYTACPSLVAMTDSQIPILGPRLRSLTRAEGLRLQGFLRQDDPDGRQELPERHADAFAALGNAVHVDVVKAIARRLLPDSRVVEKGPDGLVGRAVQLSFTMPYGKAHEISRETRTNGSSARADAWDGRPEERSDCGSSDLAEKSSPA